MGGRAGELHGHVLPKHLLVVNGRHGDKAWALTWEDQRGDKAVKDKEGSGREAQRCCVCVCVCVSVCLCAHVCRGVREGTEQVNTERDGCLQGG